MKSIMTADNDDQSVTSVTKRVKGMVKKIFPFKKSKALPATTSSPESAPVDEIFTTSILPAPNVDDSFEAEATVLPPTPKKEEEQPAPPEKNDGKSVDEENVVYKDDNDGKKGGCCAPCEGQCIVM